MRFFKRIISQWKLTGGFVLILGEGKEEEEGKERTDKKQKSVKGDGAVLGERIHIPSNYQLTAFKNELFFLVSFRCQNPRR